ncbi:ATP-binding cassette domain-containing protein [Serratia ureilytica]
MKLAVIGPNGGGKSSLLRALIGETRPDSGGIYWRGRALSGGSAAERARSTPFWRKRFAGFAAVG